MCTIGGVERADVFSWTFRVARKQHNCDGCGCQVQAGERYGVLFTIFEGYLDNAKSCLPCYRAAKRFGEEHEYFPHPSALAETIQECVAWDDESARKWRPTLRAILARRPNGAA